MEELSMSKLIEAQQKVKSQANKSIDLLKTTNDKELIENLIRTIEKLFDEYSYLYQKGTKIKMEKDKEDAINALKMQYLKEEE